MEANGGYTPNRPPPQGATGGKTTITRGGFLKRALGIPTPDQKKLIIDARRDPRMKGFKAVTFYAYFVSAIPIFITLALLGYLEFLGINIDVPIAWKWIVGAGIVIIALSLFRIYTVENIRDFSKWAYDVTMGTSGLQLLWGIFTFIFGVQSGGADIVVGGVLTAYLATKRNAYMEWSKRIWGW